MSDVMSDPVWTSDRVVDPDGGVIWLAVDAFPTEEAVARELDGQFAHVIGRGTWWKLRRLDLHNEEDAYLHDEWNVTTSVIPADADHPGAREFWTVALHPHSPWAAV